MNWLERLHESRVHTRRVRVLAEAAARLLPAGADLLDIGCGDGRLAAHLAALRPGLDVVGADIAARPGAKIPVTVYDGRTLPFAAGAFESALLIDVLHHAADPAGLLREAARVARRAVVIKDHLLGGFAAAPLLRFMDRVGNCRHGVPLPGNYLDESRWRSLFAESRLVVEATDTLPGLYPFPAHLLFGRSLHFMSRLGKIPESGRTGLSPHPG